MCRPTEFSVDYVINPWMKIGSVDKNIALRQWGTLVSAYERLGINVEIISQKKYLPDMVFTADQGIISGINVLMSNFKYRERRGERFPYVEWFKKRGFRPKFLANANFFEGTGDSVLGNDTLFVGVGFRTTISSCGEISSNLNIKVVPLKLVDPRFYHLDTCFFILNETTAFYYPDAFSEKAKKTLKKTFRILFPLTKKEAFGFATNSCVTDHHVVLQKGNPHFNQILHDLGYETVEVDTSEFFKSGGGIHCLTLSLSESYD